MYLYTTLSCYPTLRTPFFSYQGNPLFPTNTITSVVNKQTTQSGFSFHFDVEPTAFALKSQEIAQSKRNYREKKCYSSLISSN